MKHRFCEHARDIPRRISPSRWRITARHSVPGLETARHSAIRGAPRSATPPRMPFPRILLLCLWLVSPGIAALPGALPAEPQRLEGVIAGAHWAALVPENWSGQLLLEAPDLPHAPAPPAAALDPATPDHQALLAAGWALATTNYRRTGPILVDAIDDLRALRDRLAVELGAPRTVLLEGAGMGGLIAILMAERHADEFHGFLARDPRLDLRDPRALRLRCDHQPRAPLLLLFGPATAADMIAYQARARAAANAESIVPVLWYQPPPDAVESPTELSTLPAAVEALAAWAATGRSPDPQIEHLPAAEEREAAPAAPPAPAAAAESPALPEEPPPTVPVDEAPAAP